MRAVNRAVLCLCVTAQRVGAFCSVARRPRAGVRRGAETHFVAEVSTPETAALIVPDATPEEGAAASPVSAREVLWVAATEKAGASSGSSALMLTMPLTPVASSVVIGLPAAVARLRSASRPFIIDRLQSSIPKEDARSSLALAACLDAVIEAWLDRCDEEDDDAPHFEDLAGSASSHSAPVFESRGFAEVQFPDLSALARNEPIATHRSRLPPAIFAYSALLDRANDDGALATLVEQRRYERILAKLKNQPPPQPSAAADDDSETARSGSDDYDPWAGGGIF